jgi:hypothetical protein
VQSRSGQETVARAPGRRFLLPGPTHRSRSPRRPSEGLSIRYEPLNRQMFPNRPLLCACTFASFHPSDIQLLSRPPVNQLQVTLEQAADVVGRQNVRVVPRCPPCLGGSRRCSRARRREFVLVHGERARRIAGRGAMNRLRLRQYECRDSAVRKRPGRCPGRLKVFAVNLPAFIFATQRSEQHSSFPAIGARFSKGML